MRCTSRPPRATTIPVRTPPRRHRDGQRTGADADAHERDGGACALRMRHSQAGHAGHQGQVQVGGVESAEGCAAATRARGADGVRACGVSPLVPCSLCICASWDCRARCGRYDASQGQGAVHSRTRHPGGQVTRVAALPAPVRLCARRAPCLIHAWDASTDSGFSCLRAASAGRDRRQRCGGLGRAGGWRCEQQRAPCVADLQAHQDNAAASKGICRQSRGRDGRWHRLGHGHGDGAVRPRRYGVTGALHARRARAKPVSCSLMPTDGRPRRRAALCGPLVAGHARAAGVHHLAQGGSAQGGRGQDFRRDGQPCALPRRRRA